MMGTRRPVDVLQVITDTDRRGPQVFSQELQRSLGQRGFIVETVALAPGRSSDGVAVPCLSKGGRGANIKAALGLRRKAASAKVVLGHGSSTLKVCPVAVKGSGAVYINGTLGEPLYWIRGSLHKWAFSLLLRAPDVTVALWKGAADDMVNELGVRADTMTVIARGASPSRFKPATPEQRAEARESFGLAEDAPVVLSVGALSVEKNTGAAIEAVGAIAEARLLIVGSGPEEDALRAQAEQKAPGRVIFAGSMSDTTKAYAAADVFVLPSLTEGIPSALVEAGLSGLPSVASAVGAVPEVIADGITGRVVPAKDQASFTEALREVLDAPGEMGEKARLRCVEKYDHEDVAGQWAKLLEQVIRATGVTS